MEIEVYRKKESLEKNPIESVDKDVERVELYESLGFKGLANLSTLPNPADWYPELTESEWNTWTSFLPTPYLNNISPMSHIKTWREYCFDTIPLPILKELETAQNLGFFYRIAIRTPEKSQTDPIAIGYYKMPNGAIRQFIICRWGESLIPYWQVWIRAHLEEVVVLGVLASLFLMVLLSMVLGLGPWSTAN